MLKNFVERYPYQFLPVLGLVALVLSGCAPAPEIREYTVESEHNRVFPSEMIRSQFPPIPFQWGVPESWVAGDNDEFSKMAWQVSLDGDEGRITLSDLPGAAGLVPQITRWRGQIGITADPNSDPMDGAETIKLDGGTGTIVDLKGEEETILGMLLPLGDKIWVFKFRGRNKLADSQRDSFRAFCKSVRISSGEQFPAIPFQWGVPDSWVVGDNDQFSKMAWQVSLDGDEGRITLSDLPGGAGLIPQVTRWRGQIGITAVPEADPMDGTETIKLDGGTGTIVDLKGEEETILGMLLPVKDKLWIFKFRGRNKLAVAQRDSFRAFCKSVRISAGE